MVKPNMKQDLSGPLGKQATMLGELDIHLWISSQYGDVPTCGRENVVRAHHSSYLPNAVSGLCGPRGCSSLTPCSEIFTMVSCRWIGASWSFFERERSQEQHMLPS